MTDEEAQAQLQALTGFYKPSPRLVAVPDGPPACDETYSCECRACKSDKVRRLKSIPKGSLADHQPWTPRQSRRAA